MNTYNYNKTISTNLSTDIIVLEEVLKFSINYKQ